MKSETLAEGVVLYCGDCLDMLADVARPGVAIVADPPYGMKFAVDSTRFSGGNTKRAGSKNAPVHGDDKPFDPAPFLAWDEVILWGANNFWQKLPPGSALVWVKRNDGALGSFLSDGELAYKKGGSGVYAYKQVFAGSSRAMEAGLDPYAPAVHPTQKPIGLMDWCIGQIKAPHIFDPFMGSGTTGVAAVRAGRKFTGVEILQEHYDTARRRIAAELAAPALYGRDLM